MAFPRYFPLIYISPKQKLATFFNKSLIKQQLSPTHLRVWVADCRCPSEHVPSPWLRTQSQAVPRPLVGSCREGALEGAVLSTHRPSL